MVLIFYCPQLPASPTSWILREASHSHTRVDAVETVCRNEKKKTLEIQQNIGMDLEIINKKVKKKEELVV